MINLKRHVQRYEETKCMMEQAGFRQIRRFDAVDGFCSEEHVFKNLNIHTQELGPRGCTASHLLVWKEFFTKHTSKKYLFVCEDDMLPHSRFLELFPIYWENTPKDFDILMVGSCAEMDPSLGLVVSVPALTTHAYIISKKGARKLYNLYQKLPLSVSCCTQSTYIIDVFLAQLMVEKKIHYYCFNGSLYPDSVLFLANRVRRAAIGGICFQNYQLGSVMGGGESVVHP